MPVTRSCPRDRVSVIPICADPPLSLSAGADTDRCLPAGGCLALVRVKRMEKRSHDKKPRAGGARPMVRPAPAAAPAAEEPREGTVGAAAEELDQVVTMLGDMDIEVEAVEETALAEEPAEKSAAEADWTEEQPETEEVERAPGETADPVRMYLQEMGGVPLLTREEEVAIAKEIETGEREVREAVFSLDLAVESVLGLGDRLKRGEIEARHVFGDDDATGESSDAAESGPKEDKRADGFLKQVAKLRRLVGECEKLRAEQQRARTSKVRKAAIGRRLEIIGQTVREQFESDLAIELEVAERLRPGIALCREHRDTTSAILLETIMADEETHIDYLETQLQLMDSLGEQLFLAQCVSRPLS